jgi:2-oxoglutarate ferredoxin oxidoreductase subunit beta
MRDLQQGNTYPWFKQRVYKLEKEPGFARDDFNAALKKALEWGDRIPIGLFYKDDRATYEDSEPAFRRGPLVRQTLGLPKETFDEFVSEFY